MLPCSNKTVWGPDNLVTFANAYLETYVEETTSNNKVERQKANNDDLYLSPITVDIKIK